TDSSDIDRFEPTYWIRSLWESMMIAELGCSASHKKKKGNNHVWKRLISSRAQNRSANFSVARFTVDFRFTLGATTMAGLPHGRDSADARWETQPVSTHTPNSGRQA